MKSNLTCRIIESHLVEGEMRPGHEIGIRIDQTLTQDATGTLVMLELEAMELDRVRADLSVQYVDHNLIQEDSRNPEDHLFLASACRRYGIWYSRPGNGISHAVHQERFGRPGRTLLGSDSHTPAAGALGMLAIGAGGTDVAMAMAGHPFRLSMPEVFGIELVGRLPDWVSAKDVILEMLRRHGVDGAVNCVLEYHGPGLEGLTAMDRHVIANMGTELGATSSVFPADGAVRRYLASQGRESEYEQWETGPEPEYDRRERIDLSTLEPLIAMPSSPGNVVPVREVAGREVYQAYVGSSANPGYRDIAVVAEAVKGRAVHERVSLDINPASRQALAALIGNGHLGALVAAGARIHQAGCNGCIGMGQAPARGKLSLRTVPRNFPGRSGTREDQVALVSPETAAAAALTGVVTDPRDLGMTCPEIAEPVIEVLPAELFQAPLPVEESRRQELVKGENIASLPELEPFPDELTLPVLLVLGDDVSTDEILPAGARVLPFRSNIPRISEFTFERVDETWVQRVKDLGPNARHAVVAGKNYGQGSSREHAALAPRYLGLRVVLARSFARIHAQNLVNFGVLPLTIEDPDDTGGFDLGDELRLSDVHAALARGETLEVENITRGESFTVRHSLSPRQREVLRAGGLIPWVRAADG